MGCKRTVLGVGINDADYVVCRDVRVSARGSPRKRKLVWTCPIYSRWSQMLNRCYSEVFLRKHPSYEGCTVCEDWLTFSKFKAWMEVQDYEGKHLDKDILSVGNKIYSPETCVFVDGNVNTLLVDCARRRGDYPIGVVKRKNGFEAHCADGSSYQKYLGIYSTPEEAYEAWRKYKHELSCRLALVQTDERVANALRTRYEKIEV